jgi:hypothetical protein
MLGRDLVYCEEERLLDEVDVRCIMRKVERNKVPASGGKGTTIEHIIPEYEEKDRRKKQRKLRDS